jgi:hypothetical protein
MTCTAAEATRQVRQLVMGTSSSSLPISPGLGTKKRKKTEKKRKKEKKIN